MLVKINGELRSEAPTEGESAGGAGAAPTEAASTEAPASTGEESSTSDSGDSGEVSSAEDSSDDFSNDFDFDAFLQHDPFANPTGAGKKSAEKEAAAGDTKAQKGTQGATQTGQGEQTPAVAEKKTESPEMELLRNQVAQLSQALNQVQQQAAAVPQAQAPASEAATPEAQQKQLHEQVVKSLPNYQFNIPDEIMQKMGSDDPQTIRAGLAEFAQGVAGVTHYNMAMQFEQRIAQLEQQLLEKSVQNFRQTTKAEQDATKAKESVFNDFYGKYPELNKPELQTFVQMQAAQLAKQYGVQGWSDAFRDQLGAHVKKILGIHSEQGPPPDAGQNQQKGKAPGNRFNAGSGAGRQNSPSDLAAEIADTLMG